MLFVFLCALFSFTNCCLQANEWVDMGPLKGSAEGHVWSKVVDEAGNTQGRNEVWQLTLPCPVTVEVIVKCPDPYPLEVSVNYQHDWHGIIELKPDRTADGFYHKNYNFKDAHLVKNLNIRVYSRKPSTDQRYQLVVNMRTIDGQPISDSTAASSSAPASSGSGEEIFAGKWRSTDKGATYIMIMTLNGKNYDVTWQENDTGAITSRGKGTVENGSLKIDWRPGSARTGTMTVTGSTGKYRSVTFSGTEPFESVFIHENN
jgi:hypothetical protein